MEENANVQACRAQTEVEGGTGPQVPRDAASDANKLEELEEEDEDVLDEDDDEEEETEEGAASHAFELYNPPTSSTPGLNGVYSSGDGTFYVRSQIKQRVWLVGRYNDQEQAARAFDRAALFLGRKDCLNFPESDYDHEDHMNPNIDIPKWVRQRIQAMKDGCGWKKRQQGLYRGVIPRSNGKFKAAITFMYRRWNLGEFESEIEAAMAHDVAASILGRFRARWNFPDLEHSNKREDLPFAIPAWIDKALTDIANGKPPVFDSPGGEEDERASQELSSNGLVPRTRRARGTKLETYRGIHQVSQGTFGAQLSVKCLPVFRTWYVGYFRTPEEAAVAYDMAASFIGRKKQTLNFPHASYNLTPEQLPFEVPEWVKEAVQSTAKRVRSKYKGVIQGSKDTYRAQIRYQGRLWYLGSFCSELEAAQACGKFYSFCLA